jgi:ribosomal protein L37AE/L43A
MFLPKSNSKLPGRKLGAAYGPQATRPVPKQVDEQIHVLLPPRCQHCHGPVILKRTEPQYQEDIVRMTIVRRFDVEVGTCACCGKCRAGKRCRPPIRSA